MSKSGREYFRLGAEWYLSLGRVWKKEKILASTFERFQQVSSPRLYRLTKNTDFLYNHEKLKIP